MFTCNCLTIPLFLTGGYKLRIVLKKPLLPDVSNLLPQPKKEKYCHATYMKKYRQRLKEDPTKGAEFRENERVRAKERRAKMNPEQRAHCNAQSKIRQQRRRENIKNGITKKTVAAPKLQKILTRKQVEERRRYFRDKKREQRARQSSQKKRREREANLKRNQLSKQRLAPKTPKLIQKIGSPKIQELIEKVNPESAKRKAFSRGKKHLPKNADLYASFVKQAIDKATPRKKMALQKYGIIQSPNSKNKAKKHLKFLQATVECVTTNLSYNNPSLKLNLLRTDLASSIAKTMKNYKLMRLASKELNLNRNYLLKCAKLTCSKYIKRKKRLDTLPDITVQSVKNFYERGDISRELPTKRSVTGVELDTLMKKRVLEISLKQAYTDFKEQFPLYKLSFSSFVKLKPMCIKTQNYMKHISCLCETCQNMRLKLKVINLLAIQKKINIKMDIFQVVNTTLCPKKSGNLHYNIACVNRKCPKCGTHLLQAKLAALITNQDEIVEWSTWDLQKFSSLGSATEDQKKKSIRRTLISNSGTIQVFLNSVISSCNTLASHLFVARWQHMQFQTISISPPSNTVVMVLDFGENYLCNFQDQSQAAYYSQHSVTIHPIVCHYNCPMQCGSVVKESLIFVSDHQIHDHHAVYKFTQITIEFLTKERGLIITKAIKFSDCCASQYKSKGPFMDVSYSTTDFNFSVESHFYGARHGKGPSDGETAVVKTAATRAVLNRKAVIRNADDFYEFLSNSTLSIPGTDNNCCHFRRKCILVKETEINRDRPERILKSGVKGTREISAVRGLAPGQIETRELSCFCSSCVAEIGECANKEIVGNWKFVQLKKMAINDTLADVKHNGITCINNVIPEINLKEAETNILNVKHTEIGEYVIAQWQNKRYIALVLQVDDTSQTYKLQYLKEKSYNKFIWPIVEDISWELATTILDGIDVRNS